MLTKSPPTSRTESIMRVGEKIRELREAKGLTPRQLVDACRVGEWRPIDILDILDFESGFSLPTYSAMCKLSVGLEIDPRVLDACEWVGVKGAERWKYVPDAEDVRKKKKSGKGKSKG